jgi:hypothetical protein
LLCYLPCQYCTIQDSSGAFHAPAHSAPMIPRCKVRSDGVGVNSLFPGHPLGLFMACHYHKVLVLYPHCPDTASRDQVTAGYRAVWYSLVGIKGIIINPPYIYLLVTSYSSRRRDATPGHDFAQGERSPSPNNDPSPAIKSTSVPPLSSITQVALLYQSPFSD